MTCPISSQWLRMVWFLPSAGPKPRCWRPCTGVVLSALGDQGNQSCEQMPTNSFHRLHAIQCPAHLPFQPSEHPEKIFVQPPSGSTETSKSPKSQPHHAQALCLTHHGSRLCRPRATRAAPCRDTRPLLEGPGESTVPARPVTWKLTSGRGHSPERGRGQKEFSVQRYT